MVPSVILGFETVFDELGNGLDRYEIGPYQDTVNLVLHTFLRFLYVTSVPMSDKWTAPGELDSSNCKLPSIRFELIPPGDRPESLT